MRVRPFFWCLLAGVCVGMLIFAATIRTRTPVVMHLHHDQAHPEALEITTLPYLLHALLMGDHVHIGHPGIRNDCACSMDRPSGSVKCSSNVVNPTALGCCGICTCRNSGA